MEASWIAWARRLQAIAQNGLVFSRDPFDRERYQQVRRVAAEILASHTAMDMALISNLLQGEHGYATPKIDVCGAVFDAAASCLCVSNPMACGHFQVGGPMSVSPRRRR